MLVNQCPAFFRTPFTICTAQWGTQRTKCLHGLIERRSVGDSQKIPKYDDDVAQSGTRFNPPRLIMIYTVCGRPDGICSRYRCALMESISTLNACRTQITTVPASHKAGGAVREGWRDGGFGGRAGSHWV